MPATKLATAPMKVAQIPSPGADFQFIEREIPKPGVGQVRIKVQACGICHSDVLTKEGGLPGVTGSANPGAVRRIHPGCSFLPGLVFPADLRPERSVPDLLYRAGRERNAVTGSQAAGLS